VGNHRGKTGNTKRKKNTGKEKRLRTADGTDGGMGQAYTKEIGGVVGDVWGLVASVPKGERRGGRSARNR